MAILTRLMVKNFGCYPEAELNLAPLSVLVGPNDSGKSTLFRAVMAHRALTNGSGRLQAELDMPQLGWIAPSRKAADWFTLKLSGSMGPSATFGVETELPTRWFGVRPRQHLLLPSGLLITDGELGPLLPSGRSANLGGRLDTMTWLSDATESLRSESPQLAGELEPLNEGLASIQCYRLDPSILRKPSDPAKDARVPALGERGEGLATVLSVLSGADWRRRQAIEEQLTKRVPTLDRFSVLPTPNGQHRLVFLLKGRSEPLEASQVSDGALLFLAFLTILYHPSPPAVLLVEEPENGVHPGRLRFILRMLRELTEGSHDRPPTSVLLTTHSPYLLDEVRPEEAFFCRRRGDGAATVRRFADIPDIEERLVDYGLGELWTAFGEEELGRLVDGR
ncbi:MAG: AAA family ATPase [Alphaproteobacteria bacterium]|nr:AAA family ATPase [Alphaproteobacteria bacterium]MCB9792887.1 AAA family ATPase [Alphaproteobacteria bacterium]